MPRTDIDGTDLRIVEALQLDGRLSNVDLAERVHLSPSPCLRRTRRLEEQGVIRGYRAEVDRAGVGLGLTVFVEIKVETHSRSNADALSRALADMDEVVACHMISGEADFLLEVVAADLEAYERFLSERLLSLPMIRDIRSNFALRTVKSGGRLPLNQQMAGSGTSTAKSG